MRQPQQSAQMVRGFVRTGNGRVAYCVFLTGWRGMWRY